MQLDLHRIALAVGLASFGGVVLFTLLRGLRELTVRRLEALKGRRSLQAIPNPSASGDRSELTLQRGVENIERSATALRGLLLPVGVAIIAALASIPLIDGVPAAVVSIVVAIITAIIGISVRPVLENVIAGVVLTSSKVFSVGDTVKVEGRYGVVVDISPTHTVIRMWDWRRYVVPNSRMLQTPLLNYTLTDRQVMANVEFHVSHAADIEEVRLLAKDIAAKSSHALPETEPVFWVLELERDSVKCRIAGWGESPAEAWALGHDIRKGLVTRLREAGISSHLNLHAVDNGAGASLGSGENG